MQRFLLQAVVIFGLLLHVNSPLVAAETGRGFLTVEQKQWISTHATELQVAPESNYPPFSFGDSGVWRGLSAGVIKQVEDKLGIKFVILPPQNLNSILERAQRGEPGIVTSVTETTERSQYLYFTQPYVSIPTVIIVRERSKTDNWPETFTRKKVAVGKGYGVQRFLEKNYPSVKLILVPDDLEGLRKLSVGEIDAVIMDVASASFFIETEKFTNLHAFKSFDYTYNLSFAVRKDLPVLREILFQALQSISERDKQTLANNWHIKFDASEIAGDGYEKFLPDILAIIVLLLSIGATLKTVILRRAALNKSNTLPTKPHLDVQRRKGQPRYLLPATSALLIALLALAIVWQELSHRHEKALQDTFVFETQRVTTKIKERMRAYGHIIRSGAGFIAGSAKVERDEWRAFVEKLDLDQSYRGIQGVGFSLLIPKERLNFHIGEIRKQGFPDYNVRPPGDRDVYSSIIYLEPFSDRNLRAFGYDMFSEPVRNEAMARARDAADLTFSGKVQLVQEITADIQAGILAYYPVYKHGAATRTIAERRAALVGWAYSPYRMNDLLDPVIANELMETRLEIFDEGSPSQETLLFDSQHASPNQTATDRESVFSNIQTIEIGGRYWTLRYTTMPGYAETSKFHQLWNELTALIVIGLLLIGLTWAFINTRRKAEIIADELTASLRQSEQRWQFAIEGAGDGVWDWNIAAGEMKFSRRWYEIQGFDEGTIGPAVKAWEELVHPEDLPIAQQALVAHFEGKTPNFACEHRVRCENGEYKWILGRGMVVARDAEGKPLRVIGTHTDITERKQADILLRESESRFRIMADSAPVLIWMSGEDKLCFWFNKVWLDFTGRTMEQEMGNGWAEGVHRDDFQRCLDTYVSAFDARQKFEMEYRLRHFDGEYRWIVDIGVPHYDDQGAFLGYIGSCIDITDRKYAEAERKRVLKIIEEAPDFIAMSDMQAHLKYLNTAGARLVGLPDDVDLSPLEIKDMHPEWATKRVLEEGIPAVLQHGFWHGETALLHRDGHQTPVSQMLLLHRDESGNPEYLSTIMRDISQQKKYQSELEIAKDAAEAANIAKSQFLATMSHEIRTPMNGILGMAQMLLSPKLDDSARQDYARTVLNSGQTLLTLLNDILDLSKVEAGKIQLESTVFEPAQVIQETRALFAETAAGKDLTIVTSEFHPAGQRYLGDPYRLRQIISNLVGNAIKFTKEGQISIAAQEVERDGQAAILEFSVTDTGIGIAKDQRQFLFKPFSQADSSTTRDYGGTGLGLSIVSSLAKLMGGEVGVDSEPGHGSRFWFRIQTILVEAGLDSRHSERIQRSGTSTETKLAGRVLVAEDDSTNRKVAQALLSKIGLTTVFAEDGQQALDAVIHGDDSDLILMDVHMPIMDGYTATEKMRQWETKNGKPRRPIIALTADAFEADHQHCLAVGMDDFLAKPIAIGTLRNVLAKWLPAESVVSQSKDAVTGVEQPLDVPRIVEILQTLEPLLEQSQFDAIRHFRELQNAVAGTRVAVEIDEAGRLLSEFRFTELLDRLNRIAATHGWNKSS